MRSLLDVNVLIALMDAAHTFHVRAHDWWASNHSKGWASCPLTENGLIRVMSNPSYRQNARFTPSELIASLQTFVVRTNHEFWSDGLSLRDVDCFDAGYIHSGKRITDLYLLALAVNREGCLVTFDQAVPLLPVRRATPSHLCVI